MTNHPNSLYSLGSIYIYIYVGRWPTITVASISTLFYCLRNLETKSSHEVLQPFTAHKSTLFISFYHLSLYISFIYC